MTRGGLNAAMKVLLLGLVSAGVEGRQAPDSAPNVVSVTSVSAQGADCQSVRAGIEKARTLWSRGQQAAAITVFREAIDGQKDLCLRSSERMSTNKEFGDLLERFASRVAGAGQRENLYRQALQHHVLAVGAALGTPSILKCSVQADPYPSVDAIGRLGFDRLNDPAAVADHYSQLSRTKRLFSLGALQYWRRALDCERPQADFCEALAHSCVVNKEPFRAVCCRGQ